MSSIYVVDSTFRRTQIKVTPGTYLRDVLEEACKSRKLQPESYTLKTHNNKAVDLSQPFRLSGLSAGAKLQLVQASRSPSVVSIALQLPEEQGATRLSDKFASNTTLWAVLRRFEEGVAGHDGNKLNITQQGVPSSNAGSGRLLYKQPCLNAMGRTLESFTDLQKSLAQLGFSNGSVLMRLSYKATDVPLEEAMTQMSKYFEEDPPATATLAVVAPDNTDTMDTLDQKPENAATVTNQPDVPALETDLSTSSLPDHSTSTTIPLPASAELETIPQTSHGISVYLAPTSSTPAAALHEDHDSAFEPSVDDARALQATLQKASKNTRLLSDKELEEQETERQAKLSIVQTVGIRVRYPDQTMIETTVNASETAAELYTKVRNTLRHSAEPFELRYVGARGHQTLPDAAGKKLVKDFAFRGKVLVTLVWLASASNIARTSAPLKDELRTQAQELKVELNSQAKEIAEKTQASGAKADEQRSGKAGKGDLEAKMKKFLGFSKR